MPVRHIVASSHFTFSRFISPQHLGARNQHGREVSLRSQRQRFFSSGRVEENRLDCRTAHRIDGVVDDQIEIFASELFSGAGNVAARFETEANCALMRLFDSRGGGEDVGSRLTLDRQPPGTGKFIAGQPDRAKVCNGGGHDEQILAGKFGQNGGVHLIGCFDVDPPHTGRQSQLNRPENSGDVMACSEGGRAEGKPHSSAAAVRDVTHGVDRLMRRSGRDENLHVSSPKSPPTAESQNRAGQSRLLAVQNACRAFSSSPLGTPGEGWGGWGEGDLGFRCSLVVEITLTRPLPEYRERGQIPRRETRLRSLPRCRLLLQDIFTSPAQSPALLPPRPAATSAR